MLAKNLKINAIKNSQLAEALKKAKKQDKPKLENKSDSKSTDLEQKLDIEKDLPKKSEVPVIEPKSSVTDVSLKKQTPDISSKADVLNKNDVPSTTPLNTEKQEAKPPISQQSLSSHSSHKPSFQQRNSTDFGQRRAFGKPDYSQNRFSSAQRPTSNEPRLVFKPKQPGSQPSSTLSYRPRSEYSSSNPGQSRFTENSNYPRQNQGSGNYRYPTGRPFNRNYPAKPGFNQSTGFKSTTPRPQSGTNRFASPLNRGSLSDIHLPSKIDSRSTVRIKQDEETVRKTGFKDIKDTKSQKKTEYRAFDSRDKQGLRNEDEESWKPRKGRKTRMVSLDEEEIILRPKHLNIRVPITIKDLAIEMKLKASQLLSNLFMKGVVLTLNDFIDDETTIQLLGQDFDCEITIDTSEEKRLRITDQSIKQEIEQTNPAELKLRNPIVTFTGHVDHGKTSLIDAIRKTNVVATEAGAITQHIGAFKCHTAMGDITILDTPGHEAFSAMRSRGADVTDIIVLVIAGDEGIKAQTLESIELARNAKVPIVVAINKVDKPNFDAENVYRQLSELDLLPEVWGGQTITVNCSATTGEGIKELLEMLALQAEILELKANPNTRARGTVIESEMHKGLGAVTTVLVQNGTLRIKDAIVFTEHWGRVKTMQDEYGKPLQEAGPSTPVKITGLSGLPEAGSDFIVVADEKEASGVSEERSRQKKHSALQIKKVGLENLLQQQLQKQDKKVLNLMLRADVQGSLEALKHSLQKIESSKVDLNIVSAAVGEISESDISLAAAAKTTIIGFHTQIESHADALIKELKVKVRLHDIIYHAVDDVKKLMVELLDKIAEEHDTGELIIKAIFRSSQFGNIAGCQVEKGNIKRSSHVRLVRNKEVIWKGTMASLKRNKEDVREVINGQECGVLLNHFNDYQVGDVLQAYDITYLTPEL